MKIIYCGDVVGRSGREAVLNNLEKLRETYKPDVIVVNVENAAHGFGVTRESAATFKQWRQHAGYRQSRLAATRAYSLSERKQTNRPAA